ncbi:MAG: CDP-alcohol phosphatidyltransferase family protein [Muribaculaceae bacterium]|nr:CDP-alcohol phosphatidyltransferase family protein [Muribaculaceae bacterium]
MSRLLGAKNYGRYLGTLKSNDTEEHIDLYFYRPIGFAWACLAERLGIHPNAITIASIFLGVGAGILFYFSNIWLNLAGMVLLVWANSYDSADGQLARMTGQYSRLGRILDGMAGDLWFITIYIAICLREVVTSPFFMAHPWAIWVLGVVAGASHIQQAAMADHYRQLHLFFLKGARGSELEDSRDLECRYRENPGNIFNRLIMWFYIGYTRRQERFTPAMEALRRKLREHYPAGNVPAALSADFRRDSLPLMKYTNILSFNWRCITLFVSLLVQMPWIYFVAEITAGNAILIYMMIRHEALCRRIAAEI